MIANKMQKERTNLTNPFDLVHFLLRKMTTNASIAIAKAKGNANHQMNIPIKLKGTKTGIKLCKIL